VVAQVTGEIPAELILPDFPDELRLVWYKFEELSKGRSYGMEGPSPITYSDMYFWSMLTGWTLAEWEIGLIKKLDFLWLKSRSE
jgi:hypothetical protein